MFRSQRLGLALAMVMVSLMSITLAPVHAIPSPKCKDGYGVRDPSIFPYGVAKPGDCKKCAVKDCATWYVFFLSLLFVFMYIHTHAHINIYTLMQT